MYNSSINSLQMLGPDGPTGNVGSIGSTGPTGNPGATGNTGGVGVYVTSSTTNATQILFTLSNSQQLGVTGSFKGDTGYGNTEIPESVGDGIEIIGSSTEGQLNIKGISGTGSLVVSATDNNVSINTIYTSTVGNVYSVGLSADTLMYLKENDLASSTRVKMDGTGDLNFQNQFYLNDSALIKYVGPVKKNQYVGITGAIDNFTEGTTGGIYIDLDNGGFYVLNTPIGIAGFTGSFKQNEIISASLLLTSDNIWKFPENVYFEQGENYLTCGKSLLNIFSFDSGQSWYAVVAQRGLDLSYTEKFITTTKTITSVIDTEVIDSFGKQFETTTQKFFTLQKINSQNQFVSSGGKTITNVKKIAEFDTCVPALSTGSCCYVKYPENTINCIDYVTKNQCDSFGGQYNPLVSCENSCGFTFGLCCSNGNCIENVSVDECNFFGGNYYAGITCGTYPNISNGPNYAEPIESGRLCFNPCENKKVACCKDGVCIGDNFSRIQCELILGGKAFTGGDCSTVNCCEKNIGRGACCACAAKDLLCFDDLTPAECASAEYDGIFMGEEERCENVNCKCVGGKDEPPQQTAPTFDLVLLNPTIRPNERANIEILDVQDAEGGDLFYKVIVKQISPTPENEFSSTNFQIIKNEEITQYTTDSLIQIGNSETKYEIIVSVKDQQNNTTTKSEIVTISTNAPPVFDIIFEPGIGSEWTGTPNADYPTAGSIGTNLVTKIIIPPNQQTLLVTAYKQLYKEISAGVWETTPVVLEEIQNLQIASELYQVSIPLGNNISGLTAGIYALFVFVAEEPYTDFNISTKAKAVKITNNPPPTVSLNTSSSNITLPTNSITLTATTSSDTTALTINETSGFGGLTITPVLDGPTTWTRTVSGLKTNTDDTTRTYTFTATATDDLSQSITSNSVSVAVNNQAPTVEVFVPSTAISGLVFANPYTFGITGFASDPDGGSLSNPQFTSTSVSSGYAGTVSFTPPSLVSTSSSGSTFASQCTIGSTIVPGNYQFTFTAKDDEGSTVTSSSKTLTILNSPPVVTVTSSSRVVNIENASFNTSIFGLSASDPNEPISSIRWRVIGVPAGAPATTNYPVFENSGFTNTDITFVGGVGGTYTVEFFCRDLAGQSDTINNLTVKRNDAPTVSITTPPTNPTITLPSNTVSFATSASDVDGSVASYSWSSSPPTNVSFSSTSVSDPTVTFGAAGTYTISVVVTDNNGRQSTSASRTVTVNAANLPPTINSFSGNTPVIISNGTASSVLTVTASDPESNPLTYTFSFVSANPALGSQAAPTITPGSGTSSNTATVTGLRVPFSSSATPSSRTYTFRASVSDGTNTPDATTNIVVNSSAPVISFTNSSVSVQLTGTSQSINLGSLFGATANDPDGGTLSYQWQLIGSPSGAATPTLTNSTSISNFQATGFNTIGTYTFRLIATDDEGTFTNSSNVTLNLTSGVVPNLTVPADQVYANNQTANSPLSLNVSNASSTATSTTCGPVTITASATPSGGAPTITPPGSIINSSNATLIISNISNNMVAGTQYTIGVTATATSLSPPTTSYKTFRIRRNALPITPVITGNTTAQTGQKITFGISGGAATDPDGSISNYSWKVSPSGTNVTLPSATSGATLTSIGITFNNAGTYGVTYSATDNNGGSSTSATFNVTISNPPTDPCALQNYSYRASSNTSLGPAGQRFLYNLIVPNIKVNGTHINATNCTAVANKFAATAPNYDVGIGPFNDRLAGYKNDSVTAVVNSGALKSFCIRMEPPASNSNNTAEGYVSRPFSNFPYLRSNLVLSGLVSSAFIEITPYTENIPVSGNRLKLGACWKVSRPYDLSLSFDSRTIGNPSTSDLVQNFLTVDVKETYLNTEDVIEAGKFINEIDWLRRIVRTDEGIPFIYRCSCWDNSTDKLVYNNWANYTNSTSDKYNLSCPSGSTRKPISLIVVRYRIEDGLFYPASNLTPPHGPGGVSTECHSALDSSRNDTLLTTDITAYYASYNNATAKTNGSQQECKLATGSYRLVKYTVNTTNPPNNSVENRKTCVNRIPGTCQAALGIQSYKYLPYGSNFDGGNPTSPPSENIEQYHWEQVPETCPPLSTACASQLQDPSRSTIERTYEQTKLNLSGTLGLTQFNSWAPPEWICLADCEDSTFHIGNNSANLCIFDMIQGCAPPTPLIDDQPPPITDANGNENLIWIKIYNSEDSTQYECVPVLYDKDVLAQYELCEE